MRRRVPVLLAAALLAGVLTACSGGHGRPAAAATSGGDVPAGRYRFVEVTAKGDVIPAAQRKLAGVVTGKLLDGTAYSVAADAGKVVVLNFFATWCAPCKAETPALQKIYATRRSQGVQLVGLDVKDGSPGSTRSWIADRGVTYPVVWDAAAATAKQIGQIPIIGLPDTVVLDRHGRVAAVYAGQLLGAQLDKALDVLVEEPA